MNAADKEVLGALALPQWSWLNSIGPDIVATILDTAANLPLMHPPEYGRERGSAAHLRHELRLVARAIRLREVLHE